MPKPSRKLTVHTPTLLQMEAAECGAACLGIILGYYGRFVPLAELRRECGVSRDGSKASNMVRAARRYGLKAKGYSKDVDGLREMELPVIIFWQFNHFVVLEGFGNDHVRLNDPANGHVKVSLDEFDNGFTGVVLAMEPGLDFEKGGAQPNVIPGLWKRLRGNLVTLAFCTLAGLLLVLPGLAAPTFTGFFVDNILMRSRHQWMRPLLVAMAFALLLQLFLKLLQLDNLRRLRIGLAVRMTSQFFWHLLRLPVSFYAQRFPGEISNRSGYNEKVAGILSGRLATTSIDVITMAFYAAVMFFYDVRLTCIAIAFAVLNYVALRTLSKRRIETNMRVAREDGTIASVAIASIQNIETLKASGNESTSFGKWAGHFAKASNARAELEQASLALGVLPTFLQTLVVVLILAIGSLRVIEGEISIGTLVAFQGLATSFLTPIGQLIDLGKVLQELQGDIMRLDDVLASPAERLPAPSPIREGEPVRLSGRLELSSLKFGYSPLSPPLIDGFNLTIHPGQRVALVGASGSGKSTLAKLICGLYEPWEGHVLVDGRPRDQVSRDLLGNSMGVVDQDIMLFEGSVRDNLTLWDATIPEDAIERACRDAAIHDDILALPNGIDSVLPEGGTSLSGGQRQRLEIARALINNPSLLILDEATSALDAETESIIDQNLRVRGCTCVIVAHRLSTIRDCDEIIVLECGKVVARGNHDELLAGESIYTKLIQEDGDS